MYSIPVAIMLHAPVSVIPFVYYTRVSHRLGIYIDHECRVYPKVRLNGGDCPAF